MALVLIQTKKEILQNKSNELNVPIVSSTHWADGGAGAKELAETVVKVIDESENNFKFLYEDDLDLWSKMETIAQKIYGAKNITATSQLKNKLMSYKRMDMGNIPYV